MRSDGATSLVVAIAAHLAREEWYRWTDEWLGDEAPHEMPTGKMAA